MQLTNLHGHAADINHAATHKAYPTAIADGAVHDHLHTVNIAGKHGHNDAALRLLKLCIKGLANLLFADGMARPLHVGGFTQQRHYAPLTQLSKGCQVRNVAVNGRIIHLEVPGYHHSSRWACQRNGTGPCNGMAHVNKLRGKVAAQPYFIPG